MAQEVLSVPEVTCQHCVSALEGAVGALQGVDRVRVDLDRKDITIELLNEQGVVAKAYKIFRCWVSEFQALPDLDANANAVAIQNIKLENEGWERDTDVPEPSEPTLAG